MSENVAADGQQDVTVQAASIILTGWRMADNELTSAESSPGFLQGVTRWH